MTGAFAQICSHKKKRKKKEKKRKKKALFLFLNCHVVKIFVTILIFLVIASYAWANIKHIHEKQGNLTKCMES